jgi:hypothetical protein
MRPTVRRQVNPLAEEHRLDVHSIAVVARGAAFSD